MEATTSSENNVENIDQLDQITEKAHIVPPILNPIGMAEVATAYPVLVSQDGVLLFLVGTLNQNVKRHGYLCRELKNNINFGPFLV